MDLDVNVSVAMLQIQISGSESFTRWLAPFAPFAADGRGHVQG